MPGFARVGNALQALVLGLVASTLSSFGQSLESPLLVAPPTGYASGSLAEADLQLSEGLALERQRKWSAAIELYEKAALQWPGRTEFRHRRRLCESHVRLARRYQDPSFRSILLAMPLEQSLELLDEVLERIERHYVEPVSLVPLMRRGLDNVEVALRDPVFLKPNCPTADAARILALRQSYQAIRGQVQVRSRGDAREFVQRVAEMGRRSLGINPSAVVLEFVYGACDALDDYSSYLSPDKLEDLYSIIDGNFVGLGVELKGDPKGLLLVGVIPGGPAAQAGLKAGERIVGVNVRSVEGLSLDEAASLLQGPEGTSVELTVQAADGSTRTVALVRRPVEVQSVVQARIVDNVLGIGYLQLTGFQKSSASELKNAIARLQREGLRFLVVDIRGNPGGLLDVAVDIADDFLSQGVIVSTRGRAGTQNVVYRADSKVVWSVPVAVLVDRDTASAGEILAGALKENQRALVIGEKSYGKGSVQSIFPLRTAPAGLKLTTAKFYSPLNQSYSEQGVQPDLAVRTAQRPTFEADSAPSTTELGNPESDVVLQRALARARQILSR